MTKIKNIFRAFLLLCMIVLCLETRSINKFRPIDRGVEIRYTKMGVKAGEVLPRTIKIQDVVYPLFKTKEEAYKYVKDMGLKSDITIVYVASNVEKDTEMLTIEK